jgi:GNAT superfamily N-acetyltransferase
MNIRPANAEDSEALWRVHTRAIRETAKSRYTPVQIEAWAGRLSPQGYGPGMAKNPFFVAEDGEGNIVGFGEVDLAKGEVKAVYVCPTRGRRGIGRHLLRTLEEVARQQGLAELQLDASLNAVPFYEGAGYERKQRTTHRLGDNGIEIPCVRMAKLLSIKT